MRQLLIAAAILSLGLLFSATAGAEVTRTTADIPLSEVYERQIIIELDTTRSGKSVSTVCDANNVRHASSLPLSYARYEIVTVPEGEDYHAVLADLQADPGVKIASPNVIKRVSEVILNDPMLLSGATSVAAGKTKPFVLSNQWGLLQTKCLDAWEGSTGVPSIIVAVLDTGVNLNHEDLQNRWWTNTAEIPDNGVDDDGNGYVDDIHGFNFPANNGDPTDPSGDYLSHGNATCSIIGAEGNNGSGMSGVAGGDSVNSGIRLMALRVGTNSDISVAAEIAGIDYAIANGADIISMSFGGVTGGQIEEDAVDRAWNAGLYIVAASGNSGQGNRDNNGGDLIDLPAGFDNCVAVGASTIFPTQSINGSTNPVEESVANYSKTGPETEVIAPGTAILCAGHEDTTYAGLAHQFTGTSAATPIVAGLAALLWSADVELHGSQTYTNLQIRNAINDFADDFSPGNDRDPDDGYGRINMLKSMVGLGIIAPVKDYDLNGDGIISSADVDVIIGLFGVKRGDATYDSDADTNNDGIIDELDLFIIGRNYEGEPVTP